MTEDNQWVLTEHALDELKKQVRLFTFWWVLLRANRGKINYWRYLTDASSRPYSEDDVYHVTHRFIDYLYMLCRKRNCNA